MNMQTEEKNIFGGKWSLSYTLYMERLNELLRDCTREEYLSEVLMPFFRMCCPENTKIIPVFDDRKSGPKVENDTEFKKRMETICALKDDNTYTVPDYIFVSNEYTVSNPIKPIIMVETKMPQILRDGNFYRPLQDTVKNNLGELLAEINSCGAIIYTDGITWMFLCLNENGEIVELDGYETICLVDINFEKKYYSTYEIKLLIENKKWEDLIFAIKRLVKSKQYK